MDISVGSAGQQAFTLAVTAAIYLLKGRVAKDFCIHNFLILANPSVFYERLPETWMQNGQGLCNHNPKNGSFWSDQGHSLLERGFPGAGLKSPGFDIWKVGNYGLTIDKKKGSIWMIFTIVNWTLACLSHYVWLLPVYPKRCRLSHLALYTKLKFNPVFIRLNFT